MTQSNKIPILLVHGYAHSQMDWVWFRLKLQQNEALGPIYSLNLMQPFDSIATVAMSLKAKVEQIQAECQQSEVILIGHSMGGIVASYFNEYLAKANEIAKIVMIGSPLQGTKLAALGYGLNAAEMMQESQLLDELTEKITNSVTPYYYVASKVDNLIIPWQSAVPTFQYSQYNFDNNNNNDFNDNVFILEDYGHLQLIFSDKVAEKIAQWVA